MGACNEGSVSVPIGAGEQYNSCSDTNPIGDYSMPPGYYTYWYWHNTGGAWYAVGNGYDNTSYYYDVVIGYEAYQGG